MVNMSFSSLQKLGYSRTVSILRSNFVHYACDTRVRDWSVRSIQHHVQTQVSTDSVERSIGSFYACVLMIFLISVITPVAVTSFPHLYEPAGGASPSDFHLLLHQFALFASLWRL